MHHPLDVQQLIRGLRYWDLGLTWTKVDIEAAANTSFHPGTSKLIVVQVTEDTYLDTAATEAAAEALTMATAGRLVRAGGNTLVPLTTTPSHGWVGVATRGSIAGELRWAEIADLGF